MADNSGAGWVSKGVHNGYLVSTKDVYKDGKWVGLDVQTVNLKTNQVAYAGYDYQNQTVTSTSSDSATLAAAKAANGAALSSASDNSTQSNTHTKAHKDDSSSHTPAITGHNTEGNTDGSQSTTAALSPTSAPDRTNNTQANNSDVNFKFGANGDLMEKSENGNWYVAKSAAKMANDGLISEHGAGMGGSDTSASFQENSPISEHGAGMMSGSEDPASKAHPYTGGAAVKSFKHLANGGILTTTVTGAEIETTAAGNSYVAKAAPAVANHRHGIDGELPGATVVGTSTPATSADSVSSQPSGGIHMAPTTAQAIAAEAAGTTEQTESAQPAAAEVSTGSSSNQEQTPSIPHGAILAEAESEGEANPNLTASNGGSIAAGDPTPEIHMAPTSPQAVAAESSSSSQPVEVTPSNVVSFPPPTQSDTPVPAFGGFSVDAHGSCFAAGSVVMTPKGEVPIETIEEGDEINIWNLHQHKLGKSKVTKKLIHQNEPTLIIQTETAQVTATPDHRFWTGHDWVPAGKLKEGSTVFDRKGYLRQIQSISNGEPQTVYNLHVESPEHNYLVEGLLVHNMKMAQ